MTPPDEDDPNAASRKLGESLASLIGKKEWSLEAPNEATPDEEALPPELEPVAKPASKAQNWIPPESEIPPTSRQIVEALLFVAGEPISPSTIAGLMRGVHIRMVLDDIAELNKLYAKQRRPYRIEPKGTGYWLRLKPEFIGIQQRLDGDRKELELGQSTLEVLSLIAYKQPVTKREIEAMRNDDCAAALRQLVRLGLATVDGGVYRTGKKFLDLFGLRSLEDLPMLGGTEGV